MGTKFANLQVRNLNVEEAEKLIPGSTAKCFVDGWTTILRDDFEIGFIEREGIKLSKIIEHTVLAIGYFDDDILTLNLYKNGKRIACHNSSNAYGYCKKTGNHKVFAEELGLDEGLFEYLKWIFKCEDASKLVTLLEKLFGFPIALRRDILDEMASLGYRVNTNPRDLDFIKRYVEEKKASENIINATKAHIIHEFAGMLESMQATEYFLISLPSDNDNFHLNECNIFKPLPDGSLGLVFLHDAQKFASHSHILRNGFLTAVYEYLNNQNFLSVYNNQSLLYKTMFTSNFGQPCILLDDGCTLFTMYGTDRSIYKIDFNGSICWKFEISEYLGYIHVYPQYFAGFIYFCYQKDKENGAIIKLNAEGNVVARYDIKATGGQHWRNFLFDNYGCIYYACKLLDGLTKILKFDSDLNLKSDLEIQDTSFGAVIDNVNNKIYASIFQSELIAVDLETFSICSRLKTDEYYQLKHTDSRGNLVVVVNEGNTIEKFDQNLKLISRHRLKGDIFSCYKNEAGKTCALTWNGQAWNSGKAKSLIRVYKVDY